MDIFIQAVQTVGFPIVMCFVMFRYMEKSDDKREEQNLALTKAVNNNTIVMTKLVAKFDMDIDVNEDVS